MVSHNLTPDQLKEIVTESIQIGVRGTLAELGLLSKTISLTQAYKMYGRGTVDRWIREKLITRIKDGTNTSSIRISRSEIEAVALASNRISWYKNYIPSEL